MTWRLILRANNTQLAKPGFPDSMLSLCPLAKAECLVPELPTWLRPTALSDYLCAVTQAVNRVLACQFHLKRTQPLPMSTVCLAHSPLAWSSQGGSCLVPTIASRPIPSKEILLAWLSVIP